MLRADKRKKEEAEEQKKKRKEERESRKKEKEKRQSEHNKRGRGRERDHGRGRRSIASRRLDMESSESEIDSAQAESDFSEAPICASQDLQPGPNRPCHRRQMPARFCDSDSDQNDGVLCVLCNENSPIDLTDSTVFWVDCSKCGCWVHNVCAFGKNTVTRKYTCTSCSES